MSKSKKQHKLNIHIKEIFNGLGFDEGIARLGSDQLLALAMHLALPLTHADDATIIKALRRIWSNGALEDRRTIVHHLQTLHLHFATPTQKEHIDKELKLAQVLETLTDVTPEEVKLLKEHFLVLEPKKINPRKIGRFLERYRLHHTKEQLAVVGEGTFNEEGVFEFFHSFALTLGGENFTKIFVLSTDALAKTAWEEFDFEVLQKELEVAKQRAIEAFATQLDALLAQLNQPEHPYLSMAERIQWLKELRPEEDLAHSTLGFALLHRIIKAHTAPLHNLIVTRDTIHAIRKATYALNAKHALVYSFEVTLPLWRVSASILQGKPLEIESELLAQQAKQIATFSLNYEALLSELSQECNALDLSIDVAREFIAMQLQSLFENDRTLHISHKMHQTILTNFTLHTAQLRYQKQREALLARTIRDFKALFALARTLKRRIVFHVGPTNSGKTYQAMQALAKADTGVYLAPLRLLALEGYEKLIEMGVPTTLLTGEEEIFDEDAGHVSSTIEMANFEMAVDVAVIDEIQMIADRDRGWAWANALIGIPAKVVYLTGSLDALEAVQALCAWLEEPLEVVYFERKNRQEILTHPTSIKELEKGTALIAFTRNDVLSYRQKLSSSYTTSVIYGNLSPEVRREEARRFREGQSDILIATDAIAMGLNLPIKTLLFTKESKFDGEEKRLLSPSEAQQIAGRAGRYGIEEIGYIGAIDRRVLGHITPLLTKPLTPIKPPFNVMANFSHIELVASILQTQLLEKILAFFASHMEFDGPFKAANFESMQLVAQIVDRHALTLQERFTFATAPVSNTPSILESFENYIKHYVNTKRVPYFALENLPQYADTQERLKEVEDKIKEISLYLWLAYRYKEAFFDKERALANRQQLNAFIEISLQKGAFIKRCRVCGKALPMEYEYAICQGCFMAQKRELRAQEQKSFKSPSPKKGVRKPRL
ncbi:MAG: hypothetical protein KU28_01325 [Sulfurovum sp. PC08-66]|nr:MAG: hypothetical protein KU28_01325 [Sulfurovum sp. PC08-66]KIM12592.1 MAG: hypothetical protein KU37_01440 [Sulfuricurvum sp. PC08-66]